jgi:LPXTG-site transpeptidase (sortase) family protein
VPGDPGEQNCGDYSTERFYDPGDPVNNYGASSNVPITPLGGGTGCTGPDCGAGGGGGFLIPVTGFEPGVVTVLGPQTTTYADNTSVMLEIPKLKLKMPIVGVPLVKGTWQVDWLTGVGGWLQGTAFPGLSGNSVITSHVVSSTGTNGPFARLNTLAVGDRIYITSFGRQYVYEVKSVSNVSSSDISVFKHEPKSVVTLVTCSKWNATTKTYDGRLVVRTSLIQVNTVK